MWFWSERAIEIKAPGYAPARRTLEASARPINLAICALTGCISWLFWPIALQGAYADGEVVIVELVPDARFEEGALESDGGSIRAREEPDRGEVRWGGGGP